MFYPCFGTVLAFRDVFLYLVHLQLVREIPDQQLLQTRDRQTDGEVSFLLFPLLFPSAISASTCFCVAPRELARLPVEHLHNPTAGKCVTI